FEYKNKLRNLKKHKIDRYINETTSAQSAINTSHLEQIEPVVSVFSSLNFFGVADAPACVFFLFPFSSETWIALLG
ncbi:hypothetical protein ACJX0J_005479, partial [Zea mays]